MRKTTVNLIVGILIGMLITTISDKVSEPIVVKNNQKNINPMATSVKLSVDSDSIFNQEIAPGLQIVEVPPPLNLMGRHPYQCYMNGKPINIPKELVEKLVVEHGNPTDNDPNFNVHNFTGNLKMVDLPSGSNTPPSQFPVAGRVQ